MTATLGTLRKRARRLGLALVHASFEDGGRWRVVNHHEPDIIVVDDAPSPWRGGGHYSLFDGHGPSCASWVYYQSTSMTFAGDGPRLTGEPCDCSGSWGQISNPARHLTEPLSLDAIEAFLARIAEEAA